MRSAAIALMLALAAPVAALANPPPVGSEDDILMRPFAHWIENQRDPSGRWCCRISDGRPVDARISPDGHWQVHFLHPETLSDDAVRPPPSGWVDVPDDALINAANPVGVPIAWWWRGVVHCVAPASGT